MDEKRRPADGSHVFTVGKTRESVSAKGIVQKRRIEVDEPFDFAEGSEVTITGVGEDRPMTPEEIAATLAAMDRCEPLEISEEEQAGIDEWARKVNEYSKAKSEKRIEGLFP